MALTREDIYHTFTNGVARADILELLKHYSKKGVTRYVFNYKGSRIKNFRLIFIPDKEEIVVDLR